MAQFNAFQFLAKKADAKTTVRTDDGISVRLDGLPKSYTPTNLAALAEKQDKVRVSLPRVTVSPGVKAGSSATLKPKDGAEFVRGICGGTAEESAPGADAA